MTANFKSYLYTPIFKNDINCVVFNYHSLNDVTQTWHNDTELKNNIELYSKYVVAVFKVKKIKQVNS